MKRLPGRPPLDDDDESVSVHVRVPSKEYDRLERLAKSSRMNGLPEFIRYTLREAYRDKPRRP